MADTISPALRALLTNIIDYAGTFPPATLPCAQAAKNYASYLTSEHAWMLRWLVVSAADLPKVPASLDGKLSVLADADEPRAAAIESKRIFTCTKPVYCEVLLAQLNEVQQAGSFAKIRTGSVKPDGIPSVEEVAKFIVTCAELKLPFKATAGLHHPIRAEYALTYETNSPRAVMHGFLNVFLAAAFAWAGETNIIPILSETDPKAFRFDELAHWRDRSLTVEQLQAARQQLIHSFGSCSFTEPVEDLQKWGWL
ncbi:MAG TPA: hypothetical protein PLN21_09840 [Gemmatales bacterium]|nr:hypothetical protein [Gemmatales bacterium]